MQDTQVWFLGQKFPWRRDRLFTPVFLSFSGGLDSKESNYNVGDLGQIPGLRRCPGGGHDNPFQYSCLKNPHGQKTLLGYSPEICKNQIWLSDQAQHSTLKTRGSVVKNLPAMQAVWIPSLGGEDTLEKEMAARSSISCLGNPKDRGAWLSGRRKSLLPEEPIPGLARVRNDLVIKSPPLLQQFCTRTTILFFPFRTEFNKLQEIFNTL